MSDRYDLVVLGGGTAGLVSAQIAAGAGARVALIERDRTGGDCLWTGCVPSKSLIAAAALAHRMRHADTVGLAPVDPTIDFGRVMGHVSHAIATIARLPMRELSLDWVADNPGTWAYHCHNAYHQEAGMMRRVEVA